MSQSTHWGECWKDHHGCATVYIRYLRGCIAELERQLADVTFNEEMNRASLLKASAYIKQLQQIENQVTHCEGCGDSWLDSGLAAALCPYCKIAELERTMQEEEGE